MYNNCKWMVNVEKMELISSSGNGGKNAVFFLNGKNDLKRKRFDRLNSKTKQCEMILKMCGLILFNSQWEHTSWR